MTKLYKDSGDPWLFNSLDGGEILIENGVVQMSTGLGTAAYLSLFGGNYDDDGRKQNNLNWWGNLDEENPENWYRSETQYLLDSLVPIPANLNKLATAAERDLAWMLSSRVASSVSCETSMPAHRQVKFVIAIDAEGEPQLFDFVENWKGSV